MFERTRSPSIDVSREIDFSPSHRVTGRQRSFAFRSPPNLSGLYPYQREGVRWLASPERCRGLLGDEMGLGKTVQALRSVPSHQGMAVIAPAFLMRVWRDMARRFRADLRVTLGELRAPEPGELIVESWDSLPEPPSLTAKLLMPQEDFSNTTLFYDEVQYAKTPSAQRTRKARLLAAQAGRVFGMTGTPIDNSPLDLWGILQTLGLEQEVFGCDAWEAFKAIFKAKWITFKGGKGGDWRFGKPTENVKALLEPVMLRRLRADVLPDLPKKTYETIPVRVDSEELVRILDDVASKWTDVEELPPFEALSTARRALAEAKAAPARTYVAELDHPCVVFSAHTAPIAMMGELPDCRVITGETPNGQRTEIVEAFQRGEFRVLAGTIGAMGVGLSLVRAWHVLEIDREYTPGANAQAEDRCARIGQAHSVLVTRFVSDHPLDKRINQILDRKQKIIAATLG